MRLIGPHLQKTSPAALHWAAVAPIVKQMDGTDALRLAPSYAIRVFRAYVGDGQKDIDFIAGATLARLQGYRHPNLFVELFNEPDQWQAEYIELARQLTITFHANGLKTCGPGWSTGTPEQANWEAWRATGWAGMDAILCHLYWGAQGFTPWHALRPFRFWQAGDPPLIIGECGRDATEGGQGGWRKDGLTPEQYVAELVAFDAELQKHPYVLGATVFTGAPDEHWQNFDTDPLVDLILAHQDPTPTPAPEPLRAALTAIWDGTIAAAGLIPVAQHEPLRVIQGQVQTLKSEFGIEP